MIYTSLNPSLLGGTLWPLLITAAQKQDKLEVPPKKEGFREVLCATGVSPALRCVSPTLYKIVAATCQLRKIVSFPEQKPPRFQIVHTPVAICCTLPPIRMLY